MTKIRLVSIEDDFQWINATFSTDALESRTFAKNNDNWCKDQEYELLFLRQAVEELHKFIGWGRLDYQPNRVEQIGLLSGLHYEDTETGKRYCVVTHVLPIFDAKGSPAYIEYSADMMYKATQQLNEYNKFAEIPSGIMGWFHTHPNYLTPFMSGTDMRTQHGVFNAEYNYSVVLNPHTKAWKVFRGYEAVNSSCRWLDTDSIEDVAETKYMLESKTKFKAEPGEMPKIEDTL